MNKNESKKKNKKRRTRVNLDRNKFHYSTWPKGEPKEEEERDIGAV